MAETVHLKLKAAGAEIKGDSTQTSENRADTIECVYYEQSVRSAREAGSGLATGRRQHDPITIRKRIDKSSPLLFKALCNNEEVEGKFLFFRPKPSGDGTTEQFYTVEIKKGRIATYRTFVPDSIEPASSRMPPMEEVQFVFHTITQTYNPDGVEHQDTWMT